MMITGPKKGILSVGTGFHNYIFYNDEIKINLAENLGLEKFIPPPFFNCSLSHLSSEW